MPILSAVSGGPDIPLDHPIVMVGRHPHCDARLAPHWVSRRRCILTEDAGEVEVRDLGGTNGTWINGRRVESGRPRPGDEIANARLDRGVQTAESRRPVGNNLATTLETSAQCYFNATLDRRRCK
jgi:pSer/pThr/pTyr-binding forkhead associated (FHA) protein